MPSFADLIQSKKSELRAIRKDMAGISPKLDHYRTLEYKANQIDRQIQELYLIRDKEKEEVE